MNWLRENFEEISFERRIIKEARRVYISRKENDSRIGAERANGFRELDSIEIRHHYIGDNNVRTSFGNRLKGVRSVVFGHRNITVAVENHRNAVSNESLIVHNEDPGRTSILGDRAFLRYES